MGGTNLYDREDALKLAQAVNRKTGYEKEQQSKEQATQTLGEMFEKMGLPRRLRVRFSNPDISYLTSSLELDPTFIGRMIRTFGEVVVLESLRRFRRGMSEGVFFGICRNVERDEGGFPYASL